MCRIFEGFRTTRGIRARALSAFSSERKADPFGVTNKEVWRAGDLKMRASKWKGLGGVSLI
jgi:hypothetical protein